MPIGSMDARHARRPSASRRPRAVSDAFHKRLERLTAAQQKELKNLLEKVL
jgi:hypothetical protein